VVVVLVDLRPLVPLLRVLDRERVQVELLGGELEVLALRIADVEPARAVAELGEILGRTLGGLGGLFDEQTRRYDSRLYRPRQTAKRRTTFISSGASNGLVR